MQVEHVIPRSDPSRGTFGELNPGNMIACCLGGAARNLYGPGTNGDEGRYLEPVKRNLSCGQAKGEANDTEFVDPRTLPTLPSVTKVYPNGMIEADEHACAGCGVSAERVSRTIGILGLNAERLRSRRERRWRALNQNWHTYFGDPQKMVLAVYAELFPDSNGVLPRFFTTSRSYFGSFGEAVLQLYTGTAGFEFASVVPRRFGCAMSVVQAATGAQSNYAPLRGELRCATRRAVRVRTTSGRRCHRLVVSARSRLRS